METYATVDAAPAAPLVMSLATPPAPLVAEEKAPARFRDPESISQQTPRINDSNMLDLPAPSVAVEKAPATKRRSQ